MSTMNYESAGVSRDLADQLVNRIGILAKSTLNKKVKAAVGGYASLYEINPKQYLAASTDGVGTKLKLAFRLNDHRTVGIDLVAMSVNDLLCVGALPLFFLDYFATGKLQNGVAEQVLEGIVAGCKQANCALVGGETAEMPDFYAPGEYDLGGFAIGMVSPKNVLPRKDIRAGDVLLGIGSSGFHSNGFSLLRKLLPQGLEGDQLAREWITPTRIYVQALKKVLEEGRIKGLAHITGSGFLNIPRMSEKVSYEFVLPEGLPRSMQWVQEQAKLDFSEMVQTFNAGIGMVVVVAPKEVSRVIKEIRKKGEKVWEIGQVIKRSSHKKSQVRVTDAQTGQHAELDY